MLPHSTCVHCVQYTLQPQLLTSGGGRRATCQTVYARRYICHIAPFYSAHFDGRTSTRGFKNFEVDVAGLNGTALAANVFLTTCMHGNIRVSYTKLLYAVTNMLAYA